MNKKVICAMSGGVDSSVAAAILKSQGYHVVGVFMLMHKNSDFRDAKIVAKKLGIDFVILDVQKEFKKRVINYLVREYKRGNTPNPCVECNKWIKFRFLIEKALQLKADYIATGHYARVKNGKLLTAKDKQKDQSYFLWTLKKNQLKKVLFPINDYIKEQVKGLARKFDLPVAEKKESQDVCFTVPRRNFKVKAGSIITTEDKKVGKHEGLIFYTIGQRKGIKIGGIGPFYVVKKDSKNNALIVSNSEKDLMRKEMKVKNINWLAGKPYFGKCKVKIRSMAKMAEAIVKGNKVIFTISQRAITSGQSVVFYLKNEVLGGSTIL